MPKLTIIAGCNGAGKSTFATSLLPEGTISFDYDRIFIEHYKKLADSELRETFAKNSATSQFKTSIQNALANNLDFCYETNFDIYPIYWVEKFKARGYQLNLIFFCIESQEIVRHRIQVRTEYKGHFVDNKTIDLKWKAGYKNLNIHYSFFDNILFVDNSKQNAVYTNVLQIEKEKITLIADELPDYFSHRLPKIYKLIK